MKTINSKKHSQPDESVQFFVNQKTNMRSGFSGTVALYDSEVYVDTRDGTGYKEVIEKLKPLIHKLAGKYHFNGNSFEDTKHDVIVHILEGIPKYDPNKNTKLSTFIEMRVNRRLINDIRDRSRISRNATYLNVGMFSVTCKCGRNFIVKLGNESQRQCVECGSPISEVIKKIPVNTPEINESMLSPGGVYDNLTGCQDIIGDEEKLIDEEVIFKCDMASWLRDEDPRVVKAIELLYFHDYTKSAAAREVGLTSTGLSMKLQELKDKRVVREIFGR